MKTSENLMYCEIYESKTGHDGEHLCWECVEFWDTDADGFVGEESTCGQNECCAQCGSDLTIRADGSTIEAATDESEAIKNTYEIGGTCVTMTADQAAAWNRGNITREICEGACVSVPCRSGTTSYVRDGEVVVEDGNPYEEFIPLWDYVGGDDGESAEYTNDMEGNSANLVREGR